MSEGRLEPWDEWFGPAPLFLIVETLSQYEPTGARSERNCGIAKHWVYQTVRRLFMVREIRSSGQALVAPIDRPSVIRFSRMGTKDSALGPQDCAGTQIWSE
jgi:hypothetical protein